MLKSSQYTVVNGDPANVTWTVNSVFRRGSTLRWRSHTLDLGIGAPYVWLVATCPASNRLFIRPPRFPQPEVREAVRGDVNKSLERPNLTFRWTEEDDGA